MATDKDSSLQGRRGCDVRLSDSLSDRGACVLCGVALNPQKTG